MNRGDGVEGVEPAEWMFSLGIKLSLAQDVVVWRVFNGPRVNGSTLIRHVRLSLQDQGFGFAFAETV